MPSAPRILLVETQDSLRGFLGAFLDAEGFLCTAVSDLMQALDVLRSSPIDLVLGGEMEPASLQPTLVREISKCGAGLSLLSHAPQLEPFPRIIVTPDSKEIFLRLLNDTVEAARLRRALHRAEDTLRHVTSAIHAGVWDLHVTSDTIVWNARLFQMLGMEPNEVKPSMEWCRTLVHPDDTFAFQKLLEDYCEHRIVEHLLEYRLRSKHRGWIWVRDCGQVALFDLAGNPQRIIGSVIDITVRKNEELRLRRSEEETRGLFEQTPDGLLQIDFPSCHILNANPAFCRLTGYTREELKGKKLSEITHPDDIVFEAEGMRDLLRSPAPAQTTLQKRYLHKNGNKIWALVTTTFQRNDAGEVRCVLQSIKDISTWKFPVSDLPHRSNLFQTAFEKIPVAIWTSDVNDVILHANSRALEIAGVTLRQAVGVHVLSGLPGNVLRGIRSAYLQAKTELRTVRVDAVSIQNINRETLLLSGWFVPLETDGVYEGMACIFDDVTDQKEAERRHVKAREELEERIRSRTGELSAINAQFVREIEISKTLQNQLIQSERLAATGMLAASIAHEINSPLQAVTFTLNAIQSDAKKAENEKLLDEISIVRDAFTHIRDTVKNLLDLNRPNQALQQMADINQTIQSNLDISRNLIESHGIELLSEFSTRIPAFRFSPQRISQVMLNLITNACEAMGKQEGRKVISVKTRLSEDFVHIVFADNGPGIAPEDLPRIFDPFFTKKKKMGMGVGLSICHNIIAEHGGTIGVRNRRTGGAVFTIKLPVEQKEEVNRG
ncbi:TPA: hypothetical protein DDW35_00020 [Candidatus Sumerlaeota bacterium]|nr:hypothetical protein [Candidatus Sumerlaeota bacterium]